MKLILFSLHLISSYSTLDPKKDCLKLNTVYNRGHSIAQKKVSGPYQCQEFCQILRICTHFSYFSNTQTCFLRRGDRSEHLAGVVSGPKHCPTTGQAEYQPVCQGSICLGGRGSVNSGNVMVDGKPVCDDEWGLEDGAVVCRQLGFPGVERVTKESEFGTVSSTFSMDNVRCQGNETDLGDCWHRDADDCDGTEAAGVVCAENSLDIPDDCREDDKLCLVGGSPGSGNVYYGGYPICHNGWDFADANVVCRALGYPGANNFTIRSHFGLATTFFRLTNFECRGHENNLLECSHSDEPEGCGTDTVAGVFCVGSSQEVSGEGEFLGIILGVILAVIVLLIAGGVVLLFRTRTSGKWSSLQKANSLPLLNNMSFENPMTNNMTADMDDNQPLDMHS